MFLIQEARNLIREEEYSNVREPVNTFSQMIKMKKKHLLAHTETIEIQAAEPNKTSLSHGLREKLLLVIAHIHVTD